MFHRFLNLDHKGLMLPGVVYLPVRGSGTSFLAGDGDWDGDAFAGGGFEII